MEIQTSYKNGKVIMGADAILERLEIALLMGKGEFSPKPSDGIGIGDFADEPAIKKTANNLKMQIDKLVKAKFPQLKLLRTAVEVDSSNVLSVAIDVFVTPEGQARTVNVDFTGV